jgi:hypothetical protein
MKKSQRRRHKRSRKTLREKARYMKDDPTREFWGRSWMEDEVQKGLAKNREVQDRLTARIEEMVKHREGDEIE